MAEKITKDQIIAAYNNRFAVKAFDSEKSIPEDDWETIVEVGRLSPSSFGFEPWKFLDIQNKKMRQDMEEFCWGAVPSLQAADRMLIVLARKNLDTKNPHIKHMIQDIKGYDYSEDMDFLQMFDSFQKNDFDLNDERSLFDWSAKQAYIPLANMMTTAAMLGVDSCPIEGFNREKLEAYLGEENVIDMDEFGVAFMVGFGYRDMEQPEKTRQDVKEIYQVIK